jgi:hypothetical protein
MFHWAFGNFLGIFEIFRIFLVALLNYQAISRLFLSRRCFLKMKKEFPLPLPFSAHSCFRPISPKSTSAPWLLRETTQAPSGSQAAAQQPSRLGPLQPVRPAPRPQPATARAKPIWAQTAVHTGRRRDSTGVRRLHASGSGRDTPSRAPPI